MAVKYTRVKDRETGHQYDVLSHKVDPDLHEVLERYPETTVPRAQKPNVKGRAAATTERAPRAKRSTAKDGAKPADDSSTTTEQGAAGA